jgi:ADP-heptose:LPS heptosyltransferase
MTTPFLRQLRKSFPNAKIDYLVGESSAIMLESNPYVSKVITFEESILFKYKIPKWFKLIKKIKTEKYNFVFTLDKHWITPLTCFLAKIKNRFGFRRSLLDGLFLSEKISFTGIKHEIFYYLDLLKLIKKQSNYEDIKMDLFTNKKVKEKIKLLLIKNELSNFVILVNSGGNNKGERSNIRKLPNNLFKQIIKKLGKKYQIVFIGPRLERSYYNEFKTDRTFNLCGLNPLESTELSKYAKRIYTTDCGAMHMAATQNDSITVFMGPTSPVRKAPIVKNVRIHWYDQDIYDSVYETYGKIPKKKYFTTFKLEEIR